MLIKSDSFLNDNPRISGEMLDRHNRPAIESLIIENEDETLVMENDPCHCYVRIEDVVDPDSPDGFYEITKEPEVEETIEGFQEDRLIDFEEIEDGNHYGKILSASINVETGVIILYRESTPNEKLLFEEEEKPELEFCDYEDNDFHFPRKKGLNFSFFHDPSYDNSYRSGKCLENLKTMPDSKLQRMHRKQLRAIRRKF